MEVLNVLLAKASVLETVSSLILVFLAFGVVVFFTVAYRSGRSISFWPPKIGPRIRDVSTPTPQHSTEILIAGLDENIPQGDLPTLLSVAKRDEDHVLVHCEVLGEVSHDGTYKARYTKRIRRVRAGHTNKLNEVVAASFGVRWEVLKLTVTCKENDDLVFVNVRKQRETAQIKIYEIEPPNPVKSGDDFEYTVDFTWPHCVIAKRDCDYVVLSLYAQTHEVSHSVSFDNPVQGATLYEITNFKAKQSSVVVDRRRSNGKYILSYKITSPQCDALMLVFSQPTVR